MEKEQTAFISKVGENFRSFDGKYGKNYVHMISLQDGRVCEYYSISKTCTKFVEGVESTFTIEEKSYNGETVFKIKPIMEKKKQDVKGVGYQRFDERAELCTCSRSSSMTAADLIKTGCEKLENFEKLADRIFAWQKVNSKL